MTQQSVPEGVQLDLFAKEEEKVFIGEDGKTWRVSVRWRSVPEAEARRRYEQLCQVVAKSILRQWMTSYQREEPEKPSP
jgi:hypothetical protein